MSEAWDEIPDGALVLPVDDDDWFAPHAASVLKRVPLEGGVVGVRWRIAFLEVPVDPVHWASLYGRRLLPGVGPKHVCTTNSYAVVKGPGARELAVSHLRASAQADRMRVVDRRLSVMNRTLASQTALVRHRTPIDRRGLERKRRLYALAYARWARRGGELGWARPYAARMAALLRRL